MFKGGPAKRICCELHVSRNTVLRSDETLFSYERERQPQPKVGPWQVQFDALLGVNDTSLRNCGRWVTRAATTRSGAMPRVGTGPAKRLWPRLTCRCSIPRRRLPVRLEPRDRPDQRRDGDREGGSCSALSQSDDVRAGLSARDAGEGV
jgi:hypothetical protein